MIIFVYQIYDDQLIILRLRLVSRCSNIRAAKALCCEGNGRDSRASNANWAFDTILKFVMAQLERVNRKVIVIISALRGYLKAIKLILRLCGAAFCMEEDNPGTSW